MIIARLAIAALSFASAVKSFAAPTVSTPVSLERRDTSFLSLVKNANTVIQTTKTQVDVYMKSSQGKATPELGVILAGIAPQFKALTDKINVAGSNKGSLLLDDDGVHQVAPEELETGLLNAGARGIITTIKHLGDMSVVKPQLTDLMTELGGFKDSVESARLIFIIRDIIQDIISFILLLIPAPIKELVKLTLALL
ncbi:hypothetical protein FRC10_002471 [Ceratobasidium sp. 414]|nr:hypothetical protein FRC10_002471 [Ceratobasidium sp. 414]